MEFELDRKSIGIVLDLSLRHSPTGRRWIDRVKKSLIELVRAAVVDNMDSIYVYHPQLIDLLNQRGDQVAMIGNYDTDGWSFDLSYALKQTLYVVGSAPQDYRKYIFLITDRMQDGFAFEKLVRLNAKDMIDAKLMILGIGEFYDKHLASKLSRDSGAQYIHLDTVENMHTQIIEAEYERT